MSSAVTYTSTEMLPKLAEWHVYGNEQQGRFLTKYPEQEPTYYGVDVTEDIRNGIFSRQLGKKAYELKDHLGNVRVTFSDIKMPTGSGSQPFRVDLLSKSENYPYGMKINDLNYNATGARYGYNSQEQSTELNLDGNHTTADFWEYDARSARRWNLDPVDQISKSNYATFANNPIYYNDLKGDNPGDKFKTRDEAAIDFAKLYNGQSIVEKREYSAGMYSFTENNTVYYSYLTPVPQEKDKGVISFKGMPEGAMIAAGAHTHGDYDPVYKSNEFSPTDKYSSRKFKIDLYVATPEGSLKVYYHSIDDEKLVSTDIPSDPNPDNVTRMNLLSPVKSILGVTSGNDNNSATPSDNTKSTNYYIFKHDIPKKED